MTDSSKDTENIDIQLGDIIEIISQDNPIYDGLQYFVKFINSTKIVLVEVDSLNNIIIKILPDGKLDDQSIESINLLSRSDEKGYARQNGLLPGKWVDIYFQGDEPFIPKQLILNLIDDYFSLSCDVITASSNLHSDADILNPNCVLVEVDDNNFATKFSRSEELTNPKRHIGVYGYSLNVLKKLISLSPTENELKFKLEQLRFIENGYSIYVSNYENQIPHGIDTTEDIKNANIYLSTK